MIVDGERLTRDAVCMNENKRTDKRTASAFAQSWNNLPEGSVYTKDQFLDWLEPVSEEQVRNKTVLELGCGNGSLLVHMLDWNPAQLTGVDLGDSVRAARNNLDSLGKGNWVVRQNDLTTFDSGGCDLVYCIGVIHHLREPVKGFEALVRNVKPGGAFHGWVYAREGNGVIVWLVDPLRKIACRFPWWFNKYMIATPLAAPFFLYAHALRLFRWAPGVRLLPLFDYCQWIAKREFAFFRHVAFDQLVTPQTVYIRKETIEDWMRSHPDVDEKSCYVHMRNGNSWKFGGRTKKDGAFPDGSRKQ